MERGKLIVLYGINNLGKSTQATSLVKTLQNEGKNAGYLKYPLYDVEPSGPMLNGYLREGNRYGLTPLDVQLVYTLNRTQYDAELRTRLDNGEWIVAEDYIGTGIAWGIGGGVDKGFLQKLNSHLAWEDLGILFQGQRFMQAQEKGHKHETDDQLMEKVRIAHELLADEYGWHRIDANGTIDEVKNAIWAIVSKEFRL